MFTLKTQISLGEETTTHIEHTHCLLRVYPLTVQILGILRKLQMCSYFFLLSGPPMIRVNRKRLSMKMILGPSVFTFLSVRQSVCLFRHYTPQFWSQNSDNHIFKIKMAMAWCLKEAFFEKLLFSGVIALFLIFFNIYQ